MTLVSLRKFLPMIKSSSPPLTEQLCSDFFRISGTPAGWAVNRTDTSRLIDFTFSVYFLGVFILIGWNNMETDNKNNNKYFFTELFFKADQC